MEYAKIITANDLLSGEVIYLTDSGNWSRSPDEAKLWQDGSAETQKLADIQMAEPSVIGPYLAKATRWEDGTTIPNHFREVFRTTGPSNRFLGKQAT